MAQSTVVVMLVGFGVVLSACAGTTVGGEDDTSGGGSAGSSSKPAATNPVKQCETYASTWCSKSFGCYVKVGRLEESARQYNIDECKRLIVERLPCSQVRSAGSSYSTCISQIKGMACSSWDLPPEAFASVAAPASCDEALSF